MFELQDKFFSFLLTIFLCCTIFLSVFIHPVNLRMELLVMDSEISGLLEFTVATLMTSPFLFADELLVTLVMTALDVVLLQMMLYVVYGHVSSWKCFFHNMCTLSI